MKILLLGKNGQLGWELQRALAPLGELLALDRHSQELCGNLEKPLQLVQTIRTFKPQIIVNAAAYTAVDKAESEQELARAINSQAPEILAQEAATLGSLLVHYSTDYVFDGTGTTPWQEQDKTAPLNVYGQSKLEGERAIQASGCQHLIFRTSWVYGVHGNNFIKTILRLAAEKESLSIISDQIGAPTGADLLADLTAHCLRSAWQQTELSGLYHLAPQGETSWYDYANFIIETASDLGALFKTQHVAAIQSTDYLTPAKRPGNSRLASTKLTDAFALVLPHWKNGVVRMLKETLG